MSDARAVYAQRYARVGLVLPRRAMTDAEWEAWVSGLDELAQLVARFSRSMSLAFGACGIGQVTTPSPRPPRSVAIIMRPH